MYIHCVQWNIMITEANWKGSVVLKTALRPREQRKIFLVEINENQMLDEYVELKGKELIEKIQLSNSLFVKKGTVGSWCPELVKSLGKIDSDKGIIVINVHDDNYNLDNDVITKSHDCNYNHSHKYYCIPWLDLDDNSII